MRAGMKLGGQSLSVVIPAYNEESCIEACVTALETVLKDISDEFEIVVVNRRAVPPSIGTSQRSPSDVKTMRGP